MFTQEEVQILDRILNARKSCRSYTDEVPTDDEIKGVLDAAYVAPYASIDSGAIKPFRHFYVIKKDDPRMDLLDRFIKEQSRIDLDHRLKEEETDPFLKENGERVRGLWGMVAEHGERAFPNPPCVILCAEWRGARRGERQSLAHMLQNMWLKATALNLDFQIVSVVENMVNHSEFCEMLGLPTGEYGFHACILGHSDTELPEHPRATVEVHW